MLNITSISWDNIYLILEIETDKNVNIFLKNRDQETKIPLELNEGKIVINITNVDIDPKKRMLDTGIYDFVMEENNEDKPIYLAQKLCEELAEFSVFDRIFPYKNNYAYLVKINPVEYGQNIGVSLRVWYMLENLKPEKERAFMFATSLSEVLKDLITRTCVSFFTLAYKAMSRLYRGENRILLMSETRSELCGNLLSLDRKIRKNKKGWKVEYSFCPVLELSALRTGIYWLKLVPKIARQNVIVVDDYCPFFKYIDLAPKTTLIQVWHAGVGFKAVGYSRFGKENSPSPLASCHRKYDYVVVGSEDLIPAYQEAFGLERDKFLPLGLARIDDYKKEIEEPTFRDKFFQGNPLWEDKEIILFAPTYRGTEQTTAFYPYEYLDFNKIYELCGDEKIFLIKMHPYIKQQPDLPDEFGDRIINVSGEDMNQMLQICDVLITDYSSVIYEFALLKKPIIFYAFDKNEYRLLRGFHWDYDEYAPGNICTTFEELMDIIRNRKYDMNKIEKFIQMGHKYNDEDSGDRLVEFISELLSGSII